MGKAPKTVPPQNQTWVEARKRYRLSHAQVQMARELGLNPRKLGKLANHRQEPWKTPLPQFIEHLYVKRFGRDGLRRSRQRRSGPRAAVAKKAARRGAAEARGDR